MKHLIIYLIIDLLISAIAIIAIIVTASATQEPLLALTVIRSILTAR
jgi:hypothetical protein